MGLDRLRHTHIFLTMPSVQPGKCAKLSEELIRA